MSVSRFMLFALAVVLATPHAAPAADAVETPVRRVILALYDGKASAEPKWTRIHQMAEMPLNHLGLVVRYHDISRGLPDEAALDGVRGILTWFRLHRIIPDPAAYLRWATRVAGTGRRFVILGSTGFATDRKGRPTDHDAMDRFFRAVGIQSGGEWKQVTYDVTIEYKDPRMVEFERPMAVVLPAFEVLRPGGPGTRSYLVLRWGSAAARKRAALVFVTPKGGYAAEHYGAIKEDEFRQWLINPFEFLRAAFATDDLPKPDTTTLSGRRIYYSHIDGDGWRNVSTVEKYNKRPTLSAEVVLREAIEPFPDLPVTVAPVVGDIDKTWFGTDESLGLAKEMLKLPQVEAGSHTYSHPFFWGFFADGDPDKEKPFLHLYPKRDRGRAAKLYRPDAEDKKIKGFSIPRAHAVEPFSLEQEIDAAAAFIESILPAGKKLEILQWSGDTSPFEAAVAATRRIGIANINGGDARFDPAYPSYGWVSPIGTRIGNQRQIYASASNENLYTALWTSRFFGFRYLRHTLRNTETPIRVKPFNIYYHMYSGEKQASVRALRENLALARSQALAPVTASHYAKIADGFYSTRLVSLGKDRWRIENRGSLQTIRFDHAAFRAVDFTRSRGIVGQRHYQGSLYVAMDAADPTPIVALAAHRPYLVDGRWRLQNLMINGANSFAVDAQGFGRGDMRWKMPAPGGYAVVVDGPKGEIRRFRADTDDNDVLAFEAVIEPSGPWLADNVRITVNRVPAL
jgi:hypothetical protein